MILQRIERLLAALEAMGAEGCMLHAPENMRYFSGYTGEGLILLGREGRMILTDSRYTEQAVHQAPDYQVVEYNAALPFERAVREAAEALKVQRLGFENGCVSVAEFERLKLILEGFTLLPVNDMGMQLRAVKDAGEIEAIRRVCQVTDDAYEALKTMIRPGVSELDVVAELGYYLQKRHHTRMGFCIVASGENGSMPHAIASERLIRANEAVTVDFGGILDGYQSDMTRGRRCCPDAHRAGRIRRILWPWSGPWRGFDGARGAPVKPCQQPSAGAGHGGNRGAGDLSAGHRRRSDRGYLPCYGNGL